jgi:hypothetical protein
MAEPILDDYEKELVRWFAQKYLDHQGDMIRVCDLPRFTELGKEKVSLARTRLTDFGLIRAAGSLEIEVLPACVELVHAWDNPPMPDRWEEATKWFRSKWWSLPVLVVFVGLPALVTWIGMLKTILEWMGFIKGSSH